MQIVKKYTDIIGDGRVGRESKSAVDQINQDLAENRHWQIHSLIVSDSEFYVVYNVSEARRLVEGYRPASIELTSIGGQLSSVSTVSEEHKEKEKN